jgi:tripartite-type tricarboxylate transporter receptor subunit TctC
MVVVASTKVPAATREQIHELAQKIALTPSFQSKVAELSFEPVPAASTEQVANLLLSDYTAAKNLATRLKLTPQ